MLFNEYNIISCSLVKWCTQSLLCWGVSGQNLVQLNGENLRYRDAVQRRSSRGAYPERLGGPVSCHLARGLPKPSSFHSPRTRSADSIILSCSIHDALSISSWGSAKPCATPFCNSICNSIAGYLKPISSWNPAKSPWKDTLRSLLLSLSRFLPFRQSVSYFVVVMSNPELVRNTDGIHPRVNSSLLRRFIDRFVVLPGEVLEVCIGLSWYYWLTNIVHSKTQLVVQWRFELQMGEQCV